MKVLVLLLLCLSLSDSTYVIKRGPKINEILGRFSLPQNLIEEDFGRELEHLQAEKVRENVKKLKADDVMEQLQQRYSISRLFRK